MGLQVLNNAFTVSLGIMKDREKGAHRTSVNLLVFIVDR